MSIATGVFTKKMLIDGRPTLVECLDIDGQTYSLMRRVATLVHLEDELYEDVRNPMFVITALRASRLPADIFTFWQRLPKTEPEFSFHTEWESLAALPVTTYDYWFNKQLKPTARNKTRKAEKSGVVVREARYDDDFVRGMTNIFNETPVRQGRRFWHYGKSFETVKEQFSRRLSREDLLGAYYQNELIGFVMLGNAGTYGYLGQIISRIAHRDKAPNNALIAKAVEVCERRRLPYLVYANWGEGSLFDFKRSNGFDEIRIPRYYVPLTARGRLALKLGLHRGWKETLPSPVRDGLKRLRSRWLEITNE